MAASVLLVASNLHWQSVAAFFVMLVGYTCFNGAILWWFYRRQPNARDVWKVQPKHSESFDQAHRWRSWWIPAFTSPRVLDGRKPAPYARLLPTVNLLLASLVACAVTEQIVSGRTRVVFSLAQGGGWTVQASVFIMAMVQQQAAEYYWHRFLHLPGPYKLIHKVHHVYKSPEPFDDLYAHPFEILAYYCVLFSPPFLLPIHVRGFILYMVLHGIAGVLDHTGVKLALTGVYNTEDHDTHHRCFHTNYGFPMPLFDILHNTFSGHYCGRTYSAKKHRTAHAEGRAASLTSAAFLVPAMWAITVLVCYIGFCGLLSEHLGAVVAV